MLQVLNKNVIIPLAFWNELKKNDYFRELIEVLEDSKDFDEAKKESTSFTDLTDYIKRREIAELKKARKIKKITGRKTKKLV
jgi:hypothetical protein